MPMKQSDKGVAELAFDRTMKSLGISHSYGRATGFTGSSGDREGGTTRSISSSWNDQTFGMAVRKKGPQLPDLMLEGGVVRGSGIPTGGRLFSNTYRRAGWELSKDASGVARCKYCGAHLDPRSGKPNSYEADHTVPYSRGGPTELSNLTPSCRACNRSKSWHTLDEWGGPR
jgi:hypothetical protein